MALNRDRISRVERQLRPPARADGAYDPAQPEDEAEAHRELAAMLREAFGREPDEAEAARFMDELLKGAPGAPLPDPGSWREGS